MMAHRKLLFVVTEDWYFVSHRLPLAVAAKKAGHDVSVATRVRHHGEAIKAEGIRLIPLSLSRGLGNPIREVIALVGLYMRERPDIVHHVALKPIVYGAFAAKIARVRVQVNAVAGMGWLFTPVQEQSGRVRLKALFRWVLVSLLKARGSMTIVQNPDDRELLIHAGLPDTKVRLVRGAGVDTQRFTPVLERPGPVMVVMAARMIWAKGVREFVEAAKLLAHEKVSARFVLAGVPDTGNPESVPEEALYAWDGKNGVEWTGFCDDMPSLFRAAHIACLPSYYREGIPKVLIEAAASGLPIVTTNAPGCREIVVDGENGLLIPAKDPEALAAALRRLIADPGLRAKMGQRGRDMVLEHFSEEQVIKETLSIYQELAA